MWIVITGKKGSGKSTVASYLAKYYFVEYAIAAPLKQVASAFGFTDAELHEPSKKEVPNALWNISARQFMQRFGTEICRDVFPTVMSMDSVWIKLMKHAIGTRTHERIVISDVRFQDELDAILMMQPDTIVLQLVRDPAICSSTTSSCSSTTSRSPEQIHLSEAWAPADCIGILNNGSLDELYASIDALL
jgi:hypothetical protein